MGFKIFSEAWELKLTEALFDEYRVFELKKPGLFFARKKEGKKESESLYNQFLNTFTSWNENTVQVLLSRLGLSFGQNIAKKSFCKWALQLFLWLKFVGIFAFRCAEAAIGNCCGDHLASNKNVWAEDAQQRIVIGIKL